MSNKLHRRNFLSKLAAGMAGMVALNSRAVSPDNNDNTMEKKDPIIRVRPMGFQWETLDPFLFCVHHEDHFPKGNDEMGPMDSLDGRQLGDDFIIKDGYRMYHGTKIPGLPGHPHRGFETITVVREGMVDHADSMGAAGRYGNGDVQWMTAGKGVQHSEMFPLIHKEKENPLELFQIWLNLPKKNKMVEPHFKMLWGDSIPHHEHTDENGKKTNVEVIAGKLKDDKAPSPPPDSWAADPDNHVAVWNIKMEPGAIWELPIEVAGLNRTLYYYQGTELNINEVSIPSYHAIDILSDEKVTIKCGNSEVSILMLQGKPIGETVIQYGPFVMNTKDEIKQAFDDYNETRFGGWPWERGDVVHARDKGRFALHADGKEELKG